MQNQPDGVAVTTRLERKLRVDGLMEELPFGHGECAQIALARASNKQPIVPSRHFEHGIGTGLIPTDKARERDRVDGCLTAVPMTRKTLIQHVDSEIDDSVYSCVA
jgi:hypothetical protein